MTAAQYRTADATALAGWVASGAVAAAELLDAALAQAAAAAPLGAICQLHPALGRTAASGVDRTAPFAGVPTLIKDLGAALAGAPTWAGCRHLQATATPAASDGAVVARLRAAGMVAFGKTTVPEFGLSFASEPAIGPAARNPWDPARTAGGSSGGAAAAVAAGIVPLAHATDAGGSIRIPAAWCGLVGLAPSRGATPHGPDFAGMMGGYAREFVLTRSVRDCARALAIAAAPPVDGPCLSPLPHGYDPADLDRPAAPQRIGLMLTAPDGTPADPGWAAAADSAARWLQQGGHAVQPADPRALSALCTTARRGFATLASRNLAAVLDVLHPAPDGLEPISRAIAARGATLLPRDFLALEVAQARLCAGFADWQRRHGILLTPTASGPPPLIGTLRGHPDDVGGFFAGFARLAPYAALANATGCPAIAVPHGRDAAGLPLSVQLLGPPGSEAVLLRLARWLEQAAPWPTVAELA